MPRGRISEGETPLSNAERQAPSVVVVWRKPAHRRPGPQRWHDAVNELLTLQAAYATWLEALPDSLHDTAAAQAL
jgi:hypothetical protein